MNFKPQWLVRNPELRVYVKKINKFVKTQSKLVISSLQCDCNC